MFGTLFNQKKTGDEDNGPVVGEPQTDSPAAAQDISPQTPGVSQTEPSVPSSESDAPTEPPSSAATESQTPVGLSDQSIKPAEDNTTRLDASALSHLDPRAAQVLTHAQEETKRIKQQFIEPSQILFGLLYDEQIYKTLGESKVDGGELSKEIQSKETMGVFRGQPTLSPLSQSLFDRGYRDAKMHGSNFVSPEDLLLTLFDPQYGVSASLEGRGLKKENLVEKVSKNPNLNYGKKTVLEKYGIDLNEQARAGKLDPIAGRDAEIDRMVHILLRRTKNNPIIIGETGVGKTAIVEGLAQKIVAGGVPKDLTEKRIFQLDVASLIAGASHRGEFEERLRGVINEVLGSGNRIVLFIDEIHSLLGTGEGEGMNAANIIKPHLARGHLQIIGATTTTEYRKNFEKDKAFERRFQPVTAEEPSEENAFEMLKVLRPKYEKFHRITLPDDSLMECVKLSKKYIGERYLPDKAVDLLDEAGAEVKLQVDEGKRTDVNVKKEDIEKVVSAWTGIPITKLTEDESEKLLKLEDRIHKRLIDQEEAVVAVSEAVRRGRIGLAAANRPIASFVFLGPTGVGKTELAKTLAELLFGRDDAMTRLDMSEYMEKHEVAKLIGAPPGYVGYEEGGQLTEAVRKKPYSIVLLDEIEKAHPDVFNILLQLLEDGRLTDNKGNTVSFKNTIVICTSNIGSTVIQERLSQEDAGVKKTAEDNAKTFSELTDLVKGELIKFFRPELLNRFDEVVIFKPLLLEHMNGIARLGIGKTAGLLKEQNFGLQITDKAVEKLAHDGFDPVYGARPLRRLIQTAIENPIALEIISKKFVAGDTIVVDFDDATNEFVFSKGQKIEASAAAPDHKAEYSTEDFARFKKTLQQVINPLYEASAANREKFNKLHDEIQTASQEGNALAVKILAVNDTTSDLDMKQLMDLLEKGKSEHDTFSEEVLNTLLLAGKEEVKDQSEISPQKADAPLSQPSIPGEDNLQKPSAEPPDVSLSKQEPSVTAQPPQQQTPPQPSDAGMIGSNISQPLSAPSPIGQVPPPASGQTLSASSGISALNEHLEKENSLINNSVEENGEEIT
jgi:ATP-dependent Clp protease ATP-binding subunit ClpC